MVEADEESNGELKIWKILLTACPNLVIGGHRSQETGRRTLALQCWNRSPCQTGECKKESSP